MVTVETKMRIVPTSKMNEPHNRNGGLIAEHLLRELFPARWTRKRATVGIATKRRCPCTRIDPPVAPLLREHPNYNAVVPDTVLPEERCLAVDLLGMVELLSLLAEALLALELDTDMVMPMRTCPYRGACPTVCLCPAGERRRVISRRG
jgi:hypothetical protein